MSDFTPGDNGFTAAYMAGGPLDGKAYGDMPLMPDGKPGDGLSIPQAAPGENGMYAVYARRDVPDEEGRWWYDFVEEVANPNPIKPEPLPAGSSVGSAPIPVVGGAKEDKNETAGDEEAKDDVDPDLVFRPADRFIQTQAWWLASELARRKSTLRVFESWPMDGFYRGLTVRDSRSQSELFMNFLGSIHLHSAPPDLGNLTWGQTFAAPGGPHDTVREIERRMGWTSSSADATTSRSLTYRLIAAFLGHKVNDRHTWLVSHAYNYYDSVDLENDSPAFLAEYPGLTEAVRKAQTTTEFGKGPLEHFWVFFRDKEPRAVLSDKAKLFLRETPAAQLMPFYETHHSLDDVLWAVLQRL